VSARSGEEPRGGRVTSGTVKATPASFRLTAERRAALRRAIDRRRRELLVAHDAVDLELFADDEATA